MSIGIETLDELKPCPFCGHHAYFTEPRHAESWGRWVIQVTCSSSHCGASIELPHDYPSVHARLTDSWNRRIAAAKEKP
jgi:Lar family restriction alleviation protein